jgi:hypothetical protein
MTENRSEPRSGLEVPVRVFGMGADGQPFFQSARATNLAIDGALLCGIEHELKVGDVIGLHYGDKKIRCKVVWVINAGAAQKIQVGVQLLPEQECPWRAQLPEGAGAKTIDDSGRNRRRFYRHKISFPLEMRDERVNTPMRVNSTDVSGNGCYVETIYPLAKGTPIKADFWIESEKITTSAVIRASDPGVGMGIEFIGLPEDTKRRVQDYLDRIDPHASGLADNTKST